MTDFLIKEDGDYLLKEDGGRIILEAAAVVEIPAGIEYLDVMGARAAPFPIRGSQTMEHDIAGARDVPFVVRGN